jgi:RHS repeat-associated protein
MSRYLFFFFAWALAFQSAHSSVNVCGTVFLPDGVTLASGELKVKLVANYNADQKSTEVVLGGNTRNYCLYLNDIAFNVRLQIEKTTAPSKIIYSGRLPNVLNSVEYNFHLDAFYLGGSSPESRNLFFAGIKEYTLQAESDYGSVVYDLNSNLNKINSNTFPNGNLVSDGSFESVPTQWNVEPIVTLPTILGANPVDGSKVMAAKLANSSTGSAVVSKVFSMRNVPEFTLSFYYRCLDVAGDVRPAIKYFGDLYQSEPYSLADLPAYSATQDWTMYTQTFQSWGQLYYARLSLMDHNPNASGGGTCLFDQVLLEEGSSSSLAKMQRQTSYFDGLNKAIQTMQPDGKKDLYSQTDYDFLGRPKIVSLPISSDFFNQNGRNAYLEGILGGPTTGWTNWFYNGTRGPNAKGYPYTETIYEDSPLGRPIIQKYPGGDWHEVSARHTHSYFGSTNLNSPQGWPTPTSYIASNTNQYVTVTEGVGDELSREYKDLFGRVEQSESYGAGRWNTTTYKYNALNQVTKITPPAGESTPVITDMTYNSLGQMLTEKSPDIGEIEHRFDASGRSRFTRTSEQLAHNKFSYVKYDNLGRIRESGIYLDANAFLLQSNADDKEFPTVADPKRQAYVINFYDRVPISGNVCQDGSDEEVILIQSGISPGENQFPTLWEGYSAVRAKLAQTSAGPARVVFVRVFSSLTELESPPLNSVFAPIPLSSGVLVPLVFRGVLNENTAGTGTGAFSDIPTPVEWGPLFGRLVRTVSCNRELANTPLGLKDISKTFNYDKYGNVTEIFEYNGYVGDQTKRWQKSKQVFDIQGKVVKKYAYSDAASVTPEVTLSYSYDNLGRLESVRDATNSEIAKHTYNGLGQLTVLDLGKGASPLRFLYTYDFRGKVKEIKATSLTIGEIFSQQLRYQDTILANVETPQWSGNISAYNYRLMGMAQELYKFKYDELNRLVEAATTKSTDLKPASAQSFAYSYHDNGSINSVTRDGVLYDYRYSENTNQLDRVVFTGSNPRLTSPAGTFVFDGNGRLIVDESKQMDVSYNEGMNRPYIFQTVQGATPISVYMAYDGSGNRKTKSTYANGSFSESKHYSLGKEIREYPGSVKDIYSIDDFGRIKKNSNGTDEQEIFVKNNLGSTVEVFNTATGALAYKADYEPYGRLRSEVQATPEEVSQKFTNKENDEEIGLDYFGARYYDADLGLWISPDAARQYSNPYTYGGNNPISSIDPDGNEAFEPGEFNASHEMGYVASFEWQRGKFMVKETLIQAALSPFAEVGGFFVGRLLGVTGKLLFSRFSFAGKLAGAAKTINPLCGKMNCVNCATALDATLGGHPASALLSGPKPISVLGENWLSVTGQTNVEALLLEGGNGARGIVYGADAAGDVGHVWNAANQGGAVNFIDGQIGAGGASNFEKFTDFLFLRTN